MRLVVAVGGNALLRRDQAMTIGNQRANVARACEHLARLAGHHELVVTHGNGPQVGLLAEGEARRPVPSGPLDVLVAETQGMVGYLIEQELVGRLPPDRPVGTLVTLVEVDPQDPASSEPTKPIGPLHGAEEAGALARDRGWAFVPEGDRFRRVVPSPVPVRLVEQGAILTLLDAGCVVVCGGGGGVPVVREGDGALRGLEGVVDKDHTSALIARVVRADLLVLATDVPAVHLGLGSAEPHAVRASHPDAIVPAHLDDLAAGSMRPKVVAACAFASATGNPAVIGPLVELEALVAGTSGTRISTDTEGLVLGPASWTGPGTPAARPPASGHPGTG